MTFIRWITSVSCLIFSLAAYSQNCPQVTHEFEQRVDNLAKQSRKQLAMYQEQANRKCDWTAEQKRSYLYSVAEDDKIKALQTKQNIMRKEMTGYLNERKCKKLAKVYNDVLQHSEEYWALSQIILDNTLTAAPPEIVMEKLIDPHDHQR
jgi:hypothetical protein